ncbi:MAG TPA: hypothetical protein VG650_03905 [Mycobacteriales bacterium]|nr:hypothetical protein [Mycobacteriales bacterium]
MVRTTWRGSARSIGPLLLVLIVLGTGQAAAARRAPTRPPELGAPLHVGGTAVVMANPRRNLRPQPDFLPVCATKGWQNQECTHQVLAAIEHARALEGVKRPRMVLPRNYDSLTVAEQTFVVTDLERVARGLKPFAGLTRPLNAASHAAAAAKVDPMPVVSLLRALGVTEYGSIWAGDFGPLASDYDWMYNDGYASNGINLACLTPQSPGCWGHRDNILGTYQHKPTLLAGAGTAKPKGDSIAEVMTGGSGRAPAFTYSWRTAKRHGANARHAR